MIQPDSQSVVTFDIFIRLLLYYALQVRCYFLKLQDNTEFRTTCLEVLYLFTLRCMHCQSSRFRLFTFTQYVYITLSTFSPHVTSKTRSRSKVSTNLGFGIGPKPKQWFRSYSSSVVSCSSCTKNLERCTAKLHNKAFQRNLNLKVNSCNQYCIFVFFWKP